MSRQHTSVDEQALCVLLACCIQAQSSLSLEVTGKLRRAVCRSGVLTPGAGPRPAG